MDYERNNTVKLYPTTIESSNQLNFHLATTINLKFLIISYFDVVECDLLANVYKNFGFQIF